MFTLIIILSIIVSILLILIVLIQNPKGGGIAANFSAANQIAGVKKTNDFIEKATWTLAIILLIFSLGSSFLSTSSQEELQQSIMQEQLENGASFDGPTQPLNQDQQNMMDAVQGEQGTPTATPQSTPPEGQGTLPEGDE